MESKFSFVDDNELYNVKLIVIKQSRHLTRGDEHSRLSMLIRALSF